MCATMTLLAFCVLGLCSTAFAVYLPYIRDTLGFTNTQTTNIMTIRSVVALTGGLFVPNIHRRFHSRTVTVGIMISMIIAFFIYSIARTFPIFCIGAFFAGISYGIGSVATISLILDPWFKSRKSLSIGIVSTGTGLATFITSPIVARVINRWNLQTSFRVETVFAAAVLIIMIIIVRNKPEDIGVQAYTLAGKRQDKSSTFGKGVNKPLYVYIYIMFFMYGMCSLITTSLISTYFVTGGTDPLTAAAILSTLGICQTIGKLLFGQIADKKGNIFATTLFGIISLIGYGFLVISKGNSISIGFTGAIVAGIGLAIGTVSITSNARYFANEKQFPSLLRVCQLGITGAGIGTGIITGPIADHYGSYLPVFILALICSTVFLVMLVIIYYNQEKK